MKRRYRGLLTLALSLFSATLCYGQSPTGTYEEELKRYEEYMKRPSLFIRTRGIERFAGTREFRALKVLANRYAKPEKPMDHVQYLVAAACGREIRSPETVDAWKAWMGLYPKPRIAGCGSGAFRSRERRRAPRPSPRWRSSARPTSSSAPRRSSP